MYREAMRATKLLELLEEYVYIADVWEDHHRYANSGEMSPEERHAEHTHIQQTYDIPLMEKCRDQGFPYAALLDIIPKAFKTNETQRRNILDDLYLHAQEEHGYMPSLDL